MRANDRSLWFFALTWLDNLLQLNVDILKLTRIEDEQMVAAALADAANFCIRMEH